MIRVISFACLCAVLLPRLSTAAENSFSAESDVAWTTLGTNENDSMPIGNGDLAANVWTEPNGDVLLLVAKADAWTELGKIVKLGRVRLKLTPNPFVGATNFVQTLRLETGAIDLASGANSVRIWIDANHPALHVESHLSQPTTFQASLEVWRTNDHPYAEPSPDRGGLFEFGGHPVSIMLQADTVFPTNKNRLTWCHYNKASVYPIVLQQEHLGSLITKYADPLLHRCFGATLMGPGLVSRDDHTLESSAPGRYFRLDLSALTSLNTDSPETWAANADSLAGEMARLNLERAWRSHQQWWQDFWDRSWIHVAGVAEAAKVSSGYAIQRWMMACSSRGAQPAKFNGGLFTVGHDLPPNQDSNGKNHNPDFREWGNSFWNQNNRLLYWPLIASGDEDLLKPWFAMYLNALPLAKDRTQLYFHHDGAAFIETMLFWGLPNISDFGWDNPANEPQSTWVRFHTQGALEVIAQMLDSYDCTQDSPFARNSLVPFADAIVTYYDQHWPRDPKGKIKMSPMQSLETYQKDAVNPTPDIAALDDILPRLLALPHKFTTSQQREVWTKVLQDLPPIALGKTFHGKLPPADKADDNGTLTILPAEKYGKTSNGENPELYVAFPYRLYGVGKSNLDLARNTYAARLFPQKTCWGQDGTQAAVLGLTNEARKAAVSEFTNYGDERFPWYWKASHDWTPDLDNGGSGMITLQLMLMQCDGRRIQLLPAWPVAWTADFKLHAPFQTTVAGHVEGGKISNLKVTPASRAKDVIIVPVNAMAD